MSPELAPGIAPELAGFVFLKHLVYKKQHFIYSDKYLVIGLLSYLTVLQLLIIILILLDILA